MAKSRIVKQSVVEFLKTKVKPQKSVVFLGTQKTEEPVTAEINLNFRKAAYGKGIRIQIVKNTLSKLVFESLPDLEGQTYVTYLENEAESDEIKATKAVVELIKAEEFTKSFNIIGSVVNGEFLDDEQTKILSKTPSKEESMARIAGALNALPAKIAALTKEISAKLARAVNEVSKTKA